MDTRAEAEEAIRRLALEWMSESGYQPRRGHYPSFGAFTTWLESKHYSHYLNFRSKIDPRHEAEGWFESAIKNYWRSVLG